MLCVFEENIYFVVFFVGIVFDLQKKSNNIKWSDFILYNIIFFVIAILIHIANERVVLKTTGMDDYNAKEGVA